VECTKRVAVSARAPSEGVDFRRKRESEQSDQFRPEQGPSFRRGSVSAGARPIVSTRISFGRSKARGPSRPSSTRGARVAMLDIIAGIGDTRA